MFIRTSRRSTFRLLNRRAHVEIWFKLPGLNTSPNSWLTAPPRMLAARYIAIDTMECAALLCDQVLAKGVYRILHPTYKEISLSFLQVSTSSVPCCYTSARSMFRYNWHVQWLDSNMDFLHVHSAWTSRIRKVQPDCGNPTRKCNRRICL